MPVIQADLVIRDARPMGRAVTDLAIRDGRIAAIGGRIELDGATELDAGNALVLPGFVEAHTHLDKSFLGHPWQPHSGGPRITDTIANERRLKTALQLDAAVQSARQVELSVAMGSTYIRSHVDVDPQVGVRSVEGVMATRERFADRVAIQIVAFPQWGLLSRPGTVELMEEALRLGADLVGGLDPSAIDRDPKGHLDVVFGLAERFGKPIDMHLHEPGHLGAFTVREVCRRTRAAGMQGKVMVSHAFCLGHEDEDLVDRLIDDLAASGVAIMTTGPAGWAAPPVKRCVAAGVVVCAGNDGLRDAWQPYGDGDMLMRANDVAERNDFQRDEDLALALAACTTSGAKALGLDGYGLDVGCWADLVLVEAETVAEAVSRPPAQRKVFKRGVRVAG